MSKHKKRNHPKDKHGRDRHVNNRHGVAHDGAKSKKIHHDWKFWTAIVLMTLGIGAYVMTLDDSLRPGGVEEPEVPAAAE